MTVSHAKHTPTKEFKVFNLGAETTFHALLAQTFANTSFSAEDHNNTGQLPLADDNETPRSEQCSGQLSDF